MVGQNFGKISNLSFSKIHQKISKILYFYAFVYEENMLAVKENLKAMK